MSLVRRQYGQVLVDYSRVLSQQTASPSVEHFFTAVLLGLYEVGFKAAVRRQVD